MVISCQRDTRALNFENFFSASNLSLSQVEILNLRVCLCACGCVCVCACVCVRALVVSLHRKDTRALTFENYVYV